jgi:Cysteine rich repeat
MRQLMVVLMALLIPTAAIAKGECKPDSEKFCKDIIAAKGDVGPCLEQHKAELSAECKAKLEAKAKNQGSAKMGKSAGTQSNSATPESDTSKIDQPARRNVPSNDETKD